MNYSFEYIDVIFLAMVAGFIFLRLRNILGKRTGFEGKIPQQFNEILENTKVSKVEKTNQEFDDRAQKEFLNGAKIAYETIITDFSDNDNKIISSKSVRALETYDQFKQALKERNEKGHFAEITFVGINSAIIKEYKRIDKFLEVIVDFTAEVITCIKDKVG